METQQLILKFALQNAIKFNGKCVQGAVIGKILSEKPELKEHMKEISKDVVRFVKQVNSMKLQNQINKLKDIAPELLEKKKVKKKELPELPGAIMGKVVTRIPPEPSKYNHIGHALSFLINYLYAKKYKGKCILRFEDTNPVAAKQEYVDAMKEDVLEYLDIKPDKTVFVSNDMPKFYKLAKDLINKDKAYVCFCSKQKLHYLRHKAKACSCRSKSKEANLKEWQAMLNKKYKEGECVLRLKGNLESDNQVMRDPVIFRICYAPHYLQKDKYAVWPMYDFENAVEEELCAITHILRSIEFGEMRIELQDYIKDLLGFKKQAVIQYGRFNVIGAITQGREIRKLIEQRKVTGWDDPSLVTLKALKRRGIPKEVFYELAIEVGLSKTPTNIDWTLISSISRKLLDSITNRYFFVKKPKKITIQNAPEQEIRVAFHPDHPERGERKFKTRNRFYITEEDAKLLKEDKIHRLMHCFNFIKKENKFVFHSIDYANFKNAKNKGLITHWLPQQGNLQKIEVLMPDKKLIKGLGEPIMAELKQGDVIQMERFAFVRLDKKEDGKLKFWFTHK